MFSRTHLSVKTLVESSINIRTLWKHYGKRTQIGNEIFPFRLFCSKFRCDKKIVSLNSRKIEVDNTHLQPFVNSNVECSERWLQRKPKWNGISGRKFGDVETFAYFEAYVDECNGARRRCRPFRLSHYYLRTQLRSATHFYVRSQSVLQLLSDVNHRHKKQ